MKNDLLKDQATQRKRYLHAILGSESPRKLIVAGPGTGKTYTFATLFKKLGEGQYLALTFIRNLVEEGIRKIPPQDISEGYEKGYPCVLIVGQRQYLNPLNKRLTDEYENVTFTQASDREYSIIDGYDLLRTEADSNLGWRVLAGLELPQSKLRKAVQAASDGTPFKALLPKVLVKKHCVVLEIIRKEELEPRDKETLDELLGDQSALVTAHFFPLEEEESERDQTQPSILLSSFEGCKGLSAGHVFIVGLNNGVMPRIDPQGEVADIEISKFVVAMTRTRKLLYLLSNRWDYQPKGPRHHPSMFVDMIPIEYRFDGGYVKSQAIEALVDSAWDLSD